MHTLPMPAPLRLLSAALAIAFTAPALATTITVNSDATLRAALAKVVSGDVISFAGNVTLSSELPALLANLTIQGNGYTLSGANSFRGLFVYSGTTSISNLKITNALAKGGDGGSGSYGGGGGAGLGGGLFVNTGAQVTISNVQFSADGATGGAGKAGSIASQSGLGYGGGGGMGGAGGEGFNANVRPPATGGLGGGGGGLGLTAKGGGLNLISGGAGLVQGAASAGAGQQGAYSNMFTFPAGGINGGGGGQGIATQSAADYSNGLGVYVAGGGGGVGGTAGSGFGGNGGFGGGGGGAQIGGRGGFGGGGAGGVGAGGFGGGGGGGNVGGGGAAGFGAGAGGRQGGGGGGAGMGGAVFVKQGGLLTIAGASSSTAGTAAGGAGAGDSSAGSGYGAGMFLQGNGNLSLSPGAGQTQSFADAIADQTGSGGTGTNIGSWALVKTGAGTLALLGQNTYSGGTQINAGVLQINLPASLGSGTVSFAGGTLQLGAGTVALPNAVALNTGGGTLQVDSGARLTFAQSVSGNGGLSKSGAGTLALLGQNTYSGGTQINAGVLQINSPASLGSGTVSFAGGTLQLGAGAATLANAVALNAGGGTFQVDSGAQLALTQVLSGSGAFSKTGAGTLTLNGALATNQLSLSAGTLVVPTATVNAGGSGLISGGTFTGNLVNNGSFSVTGGSVNGALTNGSTGTLSLTTALQTTGAVTNQGRIDLGPTAGLSGSALQNNGVINVTGGGVRLNGGVTLGATAPGQSILNNGQLIVDNSTLIVTSGLLNGSTATVRVTGNSWAAFQGAFLNGGVMNVADGSAASFLGPVTRLTGMDFTGGGTVVYNGGLAVFFNGPGLIQDAGTAIFGSGNVFALTIGGTTQCTSACANNVTRSYTHYAAAGSLNLDGVLKLSSFIDFVAQAGQRFDLLDWGGSLYGHFSSIDASGLRLAPGTALDTSRLYVDGSIAVVAVPEPAGWALMLGGLGCVGWLKTRRRARV